MTNWHARNEIRESLLVGLGLGPVQVNRIVDRIYERLASRRLTIVPTYLGDEMYEAILEKDPTISYKDASRVYVTALAKHNSYNQAPPPDPEPDGYFW